MKKLVVSILFLFSITLFSQDRLIQDSIFIEYNGDTELVKMINYEGTNIRGFKILNNYFKSEEKRKAKIKYLREHGGGRLPHFYFFFSGEKNFSVSREYEEFKFVDPEDISKFKINLGFRQRVFFVEKLERGKYKVYQTYSNSD